MVQEHLTGCLVDASEHRAHHRHRRAHRQRLGQIAGILDPAVGHDRHVGAQSCPHRVSNRRQLRHPHARNDPCRADGSWTDADLHRVGARLDQRPRAIVRGNIAGDDLDPVGLTFDALNSAGDVRIVAVGGVDHHHIHAGIHQRHRALIASITHG